MDEAPGTLSILLVDDDATEKTILGNILAVLAPGRVRLDHVGKCSEAMARLQARRFDLILLDNRLSQRMSARVSVPMIRAANRGAPMAVISNDTSPAYLQNPADLGVDFIVDKSDMIDFLKAWLDRKAQLQALPA